VLGSSSVHAPAVLQQERVGTYIACLSLSIASLLLLLLLLVVVMLTLLLTLLLTCCLLRVVAVFTPVARHV
jgi:hypothetical protein